MNNEELRHLISKGGYIISLEDIENSILKDIEYIYGLETALYLHGLGPHRLYPITIYTTNPRFLSSRMIEAILVDDFEIFNWIENEQGRRLTDEEYSLCDMIYKDRNVQIITESLADYYCKNEEDLTELMNMSERFGVTERLLYELEFSKDFYNY